ncbi:MAG: hypothetical protein WKF41_08085 [Gaiellaceae bacterium]
MDVVAKPEVIESIQERGSAPYVWPRKAHRCGGTIQLGASTERPDRAFRRVDVHGIELYVTVGLKQPESLHLELGRRGHIRAFWNGLAWIS